MIHSCNCYSLYQDRKYGKDMRVFNPIGRGGRGDKRKGVARCTVCSRILPSTAGVINQVRPMLPKVDRPLQLVTHKRLERGREYHRR